MRMKVRRDWIEIEPEDEEDEAYIEHVLGDHPVVERVNVHGLSSLAYLKIRKRDPVERARDLLGPPAGADLLKSVRTPEWEESGSATYVPVELVQSTEPEQPELLECPKCGLRWVYDGHGKKWATCPRCSRPVKLGGAQSEERAK